MTRRYSQVIARITKKPSLEQRVFNGQLELNLHADTFVAGRNCLLMHYTERVCDVMPYSDNYKAKKAIPIVQAITGYTNLAGEQFILIINEAIWMPEMETFLVNPSQMHDYGTRV